MASKIVTIDLGGIEYDIYIGETLLYRIADMIPQEVAGGQFFIVTDENVMDYAQQVKDALLAQKAAFCDVLMLPPGEKTKSFEMYQHVCEWMLDRKISRDAVVVAVGGGVIGDLTGFAAASILRGVRFVQVPTTLLAQVDSSVGGKTGINTSYGKNLVGAFYQPDVVVADIETLKTLPRRELLAGYAEVVKYGLIEDLNFFEWLEDHGRDVCALDAEAVSYAIETSVRAKADVVIADEKEKGRRALLNLGHTFGHALEAAAGYDGRLLHGEAVSIGMVMAFDLSVRLGLCRAEDLERVEEHLALVGLPTRAAFIAPNLTQSPDQIVDLMGNDKKVKNGRLNFILVKGIGDAFVSADVPVELVREVVKDSLGSDGQSLNEMLQDKWKSAFSSQ
ncbi:MAG: 3-dehydroquinate synthase [Micavibrio sp.]|nr:3-dehydroquinate synthase [Micavibrio sp.]|tara:strand:+ start:2542 stop:3717 length:1176 start_codon:yes stop_codon:yes gene_type:complete